MMFNSNTDTTLEELLTEGTIEDNYIDDAIDNCEVGIPDDLDDDVDEDEIAYSSDDDDDDESEDTDYFLYGEHPEDTVEVVATDDDTTEDEVAEAIHKANTGDINDLFEMDSSLFGLDII